MAGCGEYKRRIWFNKKPIELNPCSDYYSKPNTIHYNKNTVYVYNPLTYNVNILLLYGDKRTSGLHFPIISPGLGIMRFCEIQDKSVLHCHISFVGMQKEHCLIPLTSVGNYKQVYIVSTKSAPPSLKNQCIAMVINFLPGSPTMTDLGKQLEQVPLPHTLIEDVCALKSQFLNEYINRQNPIVKNLGPCEDCISILKNNGIIPSPRCTRNITRD